MRLISYGFSAVVLLSALPARVYASASFDACYEKYPLPSREINFIEESTGHDPRQFLLRRCISQQRKAIISKRRLEREQLRDTARFNRSAENVKNMRDLTETGIQDAIRRQNLKKSRFRARTNVLEIPELIKTRHSRRVLVRKSEGYDRINAIRRRLMQEKNTDLCTSVGAIRKYNNPCRRYGSLQGTGARSPYLKYLQE